MVYCGRYYIDKTIDFNKLTSSKYFNNGIIEIFTSKHFLYYAVYKKVVIYWKYFDYNMKYFDL